MSQDLLEVVKDGVAILTMNRPERLNALSHSMLAAMLDALPRLAEDPGVGAVILTGAGRAFCAGADLKAVKELVPDPVRWSGFMRLWHRVFNRVEALPAPVIAGVHGLALAGGLELVLVADLVVMDATARLGDQHTNFGLIAGGGGSQRLPRLIGARRALDLFFSARWIDAQTAHDWGLVNHVCAPDRLAAESLEYCRALGERSRSGLATMKRLARHGLGLPPSEALALEEKLAPEAMRTPDVDEGLAAFQQRRKPVFGA